MPPVLCEQHCALFGARWADYVRMRSTRL